MKLKGSLCLFALVRVAGAQEVLTAPPDFSVTPPALQELQAERSGVIQANESVPAVLAVNPALQWGPVGMRPHLLYRVLYGDGIQSNPGHPEKTVIQQFSPGMVLSLGSHWSLDYTPTLTYYSSRQFRNTFDQSVGLTGGAAYEDWIFALSQSYAASSAPLVETGTQTDTQTYSTALSASHRLNSKISLDLTLNQNFTEAYQFSGAREWSTMDWLNYQFWARLDAGIGAGAGYVNEDTGSDNIYEQLQARINWRATDKTSFQVHGGLEDRQFLGLAGASSRINPVFGASIQYQPVETTRLSLSADRAVSTSYLQDQVSENVNLTGTVSQRLLKKLFLSLAAGYSRSQYVATVQNVAAGRVDDYYSLNVRLNYAFRNRGTLALTYQYSKDVSSQAGFGYSSSQVGLELGYQF